MMKKILSIFVLCFCASIPTFGQGAWFYGGGNGSGVTITTVSGLSSVPSKTKGTIAVVTDGNSATDCTVGTGSTVVVCQYSGVSWSQMVAASSGATAFSAITAATNTNTGFILAPTATGTVPWTHTCPTGITVDCYDWYLNVTKEMWLDSGGLLHLAQTPGFNISGTAANLSGTPLLPTGTTAHTYAQADNSTDIATTAYVDAGLGVKAPINSPTFTGTVGGVTATMVGLGNVTNNSQALLSVWPSTSPTQAYLPLGVSGGGSYAPVAMSQDCTITYLGVITCTKTNNVAFGTGATATIANYAPLAGATFTGEVVTPASAAVAGAGLNLPPGTAPNSPSNGDLWSTSAGFYGYANGSVVGPFGTGGGGSMVYPTGTGIPQVNTGTSWGSTIVSPTGPNGVPQFISSVPSGGVGQPFAAGLLGVPIDATNPATLLVTDRANYLNWTTGTTLALPAVTTDFASNFPFVIKNTSTTLTITPNAGASDLIDGASSAALLPNFAAQVFQDSTTAPGHWFTVKYPTFAAFGSNCGDSSHGLAWSTTAGFSCQSITGTAAAGGSNTQLQYNNSTALGGISGWTTNGNTTLTAGATSLFDMSSATNTAAFKLPTNTSNTASAGGVLDYDSTSSNYHGYNGADSIFAPFVTSLLPATGHLVALTIASGKVTLSDGGAVPGTATTVNGQTCTLGSTCAVESATAGQVAISGGSTAPLTGAADLTYSTHTFSGISTTIFDLSPATGTAAFKVPSNTTNTATAAGVIDFDTTNKNFHGYVNGADSIFANFASAPTTNVIPKAVIASGNTLLANSGITDNGTTITTSEPIIGSAIIDGKIPTFVFGGSATPCPTGSHCALGATYSTGVYFFRPTTATSANFADLPATVLGDEYCVKNSTTGSAPVTGVITITVPTSSYLIYNGTIGTISSNITSGGAAGDAACFHASNSTQWEVYAQVGTWTLH